MLTITIVAELCWFVGCAHLVEHDPERPHIYFWADQGVFYLYFGRDVAHCSAFFHHECFAVVLGGHHVRESEVAEFDDGKFSLVLFLFRRPVEEDVLDFHVTMNHSRHVAEVEAVEDIFSILLQFTLVHDGGQSLQVS